MLRVENLKKTYGTRTLFAGVTYHFPQGERIALVGANGAGKTTFLDILCDLESRDDGEILTPANVSVGYLPQKPNEFPEPTVLAECVAGAARLTQLHKDMEEALATLERVDAESPEGVRALLAYERSETAYRTYGGYSIAAKATTILKGLGFSEERLGQNPHELSGGWRMRLELARLFIREPEFLILDEPTNHLDLPSLVWVESYLQRFAGTLLFVSHDRALLNRLSTITLHLHGGKVTPYRGNFDAFLEAREQRLMQEQATLDQLRRRRESMEDFVRRFGAKATKAAQAQSRVKMIARIRDVENELGGDASSTDPAEMFIQIPPAPKTARIVLEVEHGAIGYDHALATGIELKLERGTKVAVIGANGIGKSTLLRTVAGRLPPKGGRFAPADGVVIAYFAQEQTETLDPSDSVLNNLLRQSTLSEKEARGLLGSFLFRGDDVFKKLSVLSGGEASRLGLACALAKKAGLLLLDEPTNHLDMASVETLAGGLADYEGTALMVSHDRTFIDAVATHIFAMLPDGRSMLFEGQLADYERLAEVAGFPNVLKVESEAKPTAMTRGTPAAVSKPVQTGSHQEAKELKNARQKLAKRVESFDKELAQVRQELAHTETQMTLLKPDEYVRAIDLHAAQTRLREGLETTEMAWLEASEELEGIVSKLRAMGRE